VYIKITDKCNMSCEHCGYACTSKGKHMSRKTWKQAIKLANDIDDTVSIGGGEPTLHPDFWEIIGTLIGTISSDYIWLATNGSMTDTAIALAGLARKGILGCALSLDVFHDPIDPKVVEAFTKDRKKSYAYEPQTPDARAIRDTSNHLIKAGRCEDGEEGCVCEDIVIEPSGAVRGCGCIDAPVLGNVWEYELPEFWERGVCSKKQIKEERDKL